MKQLAVLAIGASMALPQFAQAGGMTPVDVEPAPMPVAVAVVPTTPDWTGFYGGAALGYGDINASGAALDGNGALGGILGGYRRDFGNWVAGVEMDYDFSNIDLGTRGDSLDSVARLKFQAGAKMNRALLYATAGAAYADASVGTASLNDIGYFGGVGVDYAISDKWVAGAEVLYHQFNDFDNSGVDLDATTVKARVAYRF